MSQHAPRTLGVFAHPDDETLSGGPLLATMARRGHVTVVTTNRGERGEVIGADLAHLAQDHQALGRYRTQEVGAATAALGVAEHHFLDELPGLTTHRPPRYTDSGMRWPEGQTGVRAIPAEDVDDHAFSRADTDISARVLAALIRTTRPDLVLTEEPDGGYGHPDHVQANRVTMRAVELAAADLEPLFPDDPTTGTQPWRVPVVAWVVQPQSRFRGGLDWLSRYGGRAGTSEHTGGPLTVPTGEQTPTIVRPDNQVDLDIGLSASVLDALAPAMRAHRTQIQAVHVDQALVADSGGHAAGWFALSNDMLRPVPARATAMVAPGWGSAADLAGLAGGAGEDEVGHDDAGAAGDAGAPGQRRGVREQDPRWYTGFMLSMTALLAILVGSIGTVFHRWEMPFGLLLSLLVVLTGSVLARALADRRGQLLYAGAIFVVILAMTYLGRADVIVTGEAIGVVWLLGAPALALLGLAAPKRWFRD